MFIKLFYLFTYNLLILIEPLTFTFTAKISNDCFQIITSPQSYYLEQTPVTYVICYFSDSTV